MREFGKAFDERLEEIGAYLDLLATLEHQVQDGLPRIGGDEGTAVTVQQQQILYSSVYLQLYNLVESTATQCIQAISDAVKNCELQPKDLTPELRREWVKSAARTQEDLTCEKRLNAALELCNHFVQLLPISEFEVHSGGGGNWDDNAIEKAAKRLGIPLRLPREASRGVKDRRWNDKGALAHIRTLRNRLAHGNVSFAECGRDVTIGDLRDLRDRTAAYLKEVLHHFESYIQGQEFILPEYRDEGVKL